MELAVAACKSITGAGLEVPPAGDALDEIHAARQAFEEADTRLEEVRADTVRLVCQRLSRIVLAILTRKLGQKASRNGFQRRGWLRRPTASLIYATILGTAVTDA
jgi:hypothetical protein